jgi:DNA repair photolyase
VSIVTKGVLITRDIDLLAELASQKLASVVMSLTTLDAEVKRTLEPRAASPQARLKVIRQLVAAGVPTGVLVAPVVPAITDHEMENLLEAAKDAGASCASYVLLRLPYEVKDLFKEWLAQHYPQRAEHVMSLVRDARNGRENDPNFGSRMRGTGPYADLIRARFKVACRRLGFDSVRDLWLRTRLPPSVLELREKLEQLRALEAGMRIDVMIVDTVPRGVDTPADLETARRLLAIK